MKDQSYKMYLDNLLSSAIILATQVHLDQKDKNGGNYILHPLRVMLSVESPLGKIVAILHDTVEDAKTEDHRNALIEVLEDKYPAVVFLALHQLTHLKNEPYDSYIQKMIDLPESDVKDLVIEVKLADLNDNIKRLEKISDLPTYTRLHKKYHNAYNKLNRFKDGNP